jgi:hypothetical protein
VAVILRILFAIRFYLIALLCVLTGFAQGFWYLANVDKSSPFGTVGKFSHN